jgi:outer membrane protein assembly factor BamB
LKRSRILRWPILLLTLAVLLLGTSGCVCGSPQATSWTGLTLKDEKIYVSDLQQVQVLGTDGELIQSVPENTDSAFGLLQIAPTVGQDYLIVAAQMPAKGLFSQASNPVVKLDIETGKEQWRFEGARGQYVESGVIATTADGADIFVIGNSDGNVYALDVGTGELAWEKPFKTGHRVWATPLIVGDTVYVGSMDRHLYALRLADGTELWNFAAPGGGAFASTPALQDGILYIGTFANRVYAIDADDGTEIWRFPEEKPGDSWFWGSPVLDGDIVYAVDVKGNVYALDAETGEQIWHKTIEEKDTPVRAGAALTEDGGTLLISSENGSLYALDTADGSRKWVAAGDGKGYVTPVVDGNRVYETRIHGAYRVRALELLEGGEGYKELWVYPLPEETETGE